MWNLAAITLQFQILNPSSATPRPRHHCRHPPPQHLSRHQARRMLRCLRPHAACPTHLRPNCAKELVSLELHDQGLRLQALSR